MITIGLAKILDQHNLIFFYIIYGIQGLFQSIGWPTVVAVMGNWFHGDTRGFIMTVWNSHTSVGNMVGKALSSFALSINGGGTLATGNNWPATFFACGALIATMSFFVFCFLKESPRHAGIDPEELDVDSPEASTSTSLLTATKPSSTLLTLPYLTIKMYKPTVTAQSPQARRATSPIAGLHQAFCARWPFLALWSLL